MKSAIFDSGTIISLTTNNLLWILKPMKKEFGGEFYITESVRKELVDSPLETKAFKFEAFQVLNLIETGVLKVVKTQVLKDDTVNILDIANNIFSVKGEKIRAVHYGEISCIAAYLKLGCSVFFIDERTTRLLVEDPKALRKIYRKKLHAEVSVDKDNLRKLAKLAKNIKILRSTELIAVAFESGILDSYLPKSEYIKNPKKELLNAMLWGVKLNGCAVSEREIEKIIRIENL